MAPAIAAVLKILLGYFGAAALVSALSGKAPFGAIMIAQQKDRRANFVAALVFSAQAYGRR